MSQLNLNSRRWNPNQINGFFFGALGVILAFLIRFGLQPILDTNLPLFFFQINTIIIVFYFGIFPALFTVFLSAPIIAFFFLDPLYTFSIADSRDLRLVFVYLTYTVLMGAIIEWLRRTQYSYRLEILVSETKEKLLIENLKAPKTLKNYQD